MEETSGNKTAHQHQHLNKRIKVLDEFLVKNKRTKKKLWGHTVIMVAFHISCEMQLITARGQYIRIFHLKVLKGYVPTRAGKMCCCASVTVY